MCASVVEYDEVELLSSQMKRCIWSILVISLAKICHRNRSNSSLALWRYSFSFTPFSTFVGMNLVVRIFGYSRLFLMPGLFLCFAVPVMMTGLRYLLAFSHNVIKKVYMHKIWVDTSGIWLFAGGRISDFMIQNYR